MAPWTVLLGERAVYVGQQAPNLLGVGKTSSRETQKGNYCCWGVKGQLLPLYAEPTTAVVPCGEVHLVVHGESMLAVCCPYCSHS